MSTCPQSSILTAGTHGGISSRGGYKVSLGLELTSSTVSCSTTSHLLSDAKMFKAALLSTLLPIAALASPQLYGPPPGPADPTTSSSSAASVPTAPPNSPGQMNVSRPHRTGRFRTMS